MAGAFVATYEHKHGTDTCLFAAEYRAYQWRDEIAKEWWDDSFPDEDPPENNIGEVYFSRMSEECPGEFFNVEYHEIVE